MPLWPWLVSHFRQNMNILRWIAAWPVAFALSLAATVGLAALQGMLHQGIRTLDLSSIIVCTFFPTVLFVVSAVLICPSQKRWVPFAAFAAALLCSGGETELIPLYELDMLAFWTAGLASVVIGALAGLIICLRLPPYFKKTPNKAPEPTPGSVTPRATEGASK